MAKPAVFLDRDGVINHDHGYVHDEDHFQFIDGVFDACLTLQKMGYLLVVITNQSGIARGLFSEERFASLTQWMDWNFQDRGIELDGIYYCPHHPTQGVGEYRQDCNCRKPKAGMILEATQDLDIDLSRSVLVGDKTDDLLAAQAAGIGTRLLVRTGKPITEQGQALADAVLADLAAVPHFLSSR